jgi:hypothetical protein
MTKTTFMKTTKLLFIAGIILLCGLIYTQKSNPSFFVNYLSVYTFFISLSIGATFLIILMNLTRAGWGIAIKRVPEFLMSILPYYALLFIPILFGLDFIFEWLDPQHIAHDILIQKKLPYLNQPFFVIRNIIYFVVFSTVSTFYWLNSKQQDSSRKKDAIELTKKMQRRAPVSILLMSLVTSFASFDWLMSLYPHWFSTIFGIYYFAGAMVFMFSVTIIVYEILKKVGIVTNYPNTEHLHDLSKLLYGFIIFWAYIAFSQYFLTWYANIPEFTQWYYPRITGEWESLFFILIIGHFIIPLFGFMSRHVKRNPTGRVVFSVLMIIMHYFDIRFMIYPNVMKENMIVQNEYLLLLSFSLIIIPLLIFKITNNKILPVNDPRLEESKTLENAI